jgi:prepilin-type N-terminal cleavage/methylation domain-containing protein
MPKPIFYALAMNPEIGWGYQAHVWQTHVTRRCCMRKGFTLLELMIVVAVIAILAVLALPTCRGYLAKSKRAEAYMYLSSLYNAQKVYWLEHGRYSDVLNGPGGIGWKPEGYTSGGKGEKFYYTYGFGHGTEGKNFFTGKLETSSAHLQRAHAGKEGFIMFAAGDIAGTGRPDIISVDEHNNIIIVQDGIS